jgi:hypothetical protein
LTRPADYREIARVFQQSKRLVHFSPGKGVFLLTVIGDSFHHFYFSDYSLSSNGPSYPRLHINRVSDDVVLPAALGRTWKLKDRSARATAVGFEVTVVDEEISVLAKCLPRVIESLEHDASAGIVSLFPFPMVASSATNLWSESAEASARKNNPSFIRLRKLRNPTA